MSRQAKNRETAAHDLQVVCRLVAGHSSLPMAAVDGAEHIVRYVNSAFCRLAGKNSEELIGIPFARAVPEGEACMPLLDRAYGTGEPQDHIELEYTGSRPNRSYSIWAIAGNSTRPAGLMIQMTDATEAARVRQRAAGINEELMLAAVRQHELLEAADRLSAGLQVEIAGHKLTEEALKKYRERLEKLIRERTAALVQANAALLETTRTLEELIQASPVGILVLDTMGKVILWNPSIEKMLGWTGEEVLGKPFPAVAEAQEGAREILKRLLSGEKLAGVELRWARKDGQSVDLRLWTAPVREATGRVRGAIAVLLDVTQLKEMEQIALTQQKMATLGHVAATIAHEIRNPLSGLNLYLHALEKVLGEAEIPNPEVQERTKVVIASMKSASTKMETIIGRVLSFSRPGPPRMEPLDINVCIREAVAMARIPLQRAGVRVAVALQDDLPLCRGDMRLFEQVILNLLTNAAQAMEGQETERVIELSSSAVRSGPEEGRHVTVSVADSGPGIPEEVRERIFEPFVTTRKLGIGIGLSITHKIISDHRGLIRAGTSRFGGALFTIELPTGDDGRVRRPDFSPPPPPE